MSFISKLYLSKCYKTGFVCALLIILSTLPNFLSGLEKRKLEFHSACPLGKQLLRNACPGLLLARFNY